MVWLIKWVQYVNQTIIWYVIDYTGVYNQSQGLFQCCLRLDLIRHGHQWLNCHQHVRHVLNGRCFFFQFFIHNPQPGNGFQTCALGTPTELAYQLIPEEITYHCGEGRPFTICDYGTADGGTSIYFMQKAISECFVRESALGDKRKLITLQQMHTFTTLHEQ